MPVADVCKSYSENLIFLTCLLLIHYLHHTLNMSCFNLLNCLFYIICAPLIILTFLLQHNILIMKIYLIFSFNTQISWKMTTIFRTHSVHDNCQCLIVSAENGSVNCCTTVTAEMGNITKNLSEDLSFSR